jgi:protein-L-isoaspartate(D-aspartate) O-methyltransferase
VDIEQARFNMIEQQIRPWDVLNTDVLDVLKRVPREQFVPSEYQPLAFVDTQIRLPHGEVMMEPKLEARLIQDLELKATDKVLEIGTGSGYMTAVLATLANHVVSVELYKDLSNQAAERLSRMGITNITLEAGDACSGWPSAGGFDAIVLTGSVPEIPSAFIDALKDGGRLIAVVGSAPVMEAICVQKHGNEISRASLFDTILPPLVGISTEKAFVF